MKALLMKDCYVLWKQMRIFILILLVFCLFNGSFGNLFVVIWASMMPYTAMAYDERSKWNQLAAMMPYSTRDIVLSKYALGWLLMVCALVLCLVVQTLARIAGSGLDAVAPSGYLLGLLAGILILNITLPLFFRFGVEKGRLAMFLIIFLVCASAGGIATIEQSSLDGGFYLSFSLVPAAIAAVVLTVVSIPLSVRLYGRRR